MALALAMAGYSIGQIAIAVIVVAAIVAVVYVGLGKMGVAIPPWVVSIFWILVVAFICIAAIRLLMSM